MRLTVLGCSDAFGSGGRLQTCYHIAHPRGAALIDCGATSLIGMERADLDTRDVSTIFISHLHGDHFSGLIWWLLHAIHIVKRTQPLTVAGPVGIEARFNAAAEALFPGSSTTTRHFELAFVEYRTGSSVALNGVQVTPFEVVHPSGAPAYALRVEAGGRTLTFSGDTEWNENLIPAAAGADLYITDCFGFEAPARFHMSWAEIKSHLPRLTAKRVLLTHMGHDMLANTATITGDRVSCAYDGLVLDV